MLSTTTRSAFERIRKITRFIWTQLLAILFPDACISCGIKDIFICEACLDTIPFSPIFISEHIMAAAPYHHNTIKEALRALKYHSRTQVPHILASHIQTTLKDALDLKRIQGKILLVPIPLTRRRLRSRGFNQAELFAQTIAAKDLERFSVAPHALKKVRDTKPQAHTDTRAARLENLRGSFTPNNTRNLAGKTVILIDDITTTGATFTEAKRALAQAGIRPKLCFAVAH